ncbi:GerMN domain-containing protein [Blastococcus goldschmidtiae]|uniref:GerMN domain-containing protein n=1 Tax=Blastococcus goldschmidtiae TaxID=3075546 RepID=A0ABU2KAU8_9ACTN|nr:GerMN domain-containing protein [Blastococcus sp. DSM 46792]MDT0277322.1 GerMN domain-containing protein [Blastococcus sp. DSM 46792]
MTGRRAGWAAAAAGLVVAVAAGCGVPTGGPPSTIAPTDVPYGLAAPSPTATPTAPPEAKVDTSRVHWLTTEGTLVPRVREVSGTSRRERLAYLLDQLAAGPTPSERDEQLSTSLPPEVRLSVSGLEGGTATIDLDSFAQAPAGVAGRRAVAQLVLTATSVPGVESVLLELAGEPIEAPLPAGELTAGPLTAEDYAAFRTPAAVPESAEAQPEVPATLDAPGADAPPADAPPGGEPAAPPS